MKIGTSLIDPATGQELMHWNALQRSFTTPAGEVRVGAIEGAQVDGKYLLVGRYANDPPSQYATVTSESAVAYDPAASQVNVTRVYQDQPPPPEEIRATAFRAEADRIDLMTRLKTATPAQIDSWLTTNVTSLASARTVLGAIIKAIALDART